MVKFERLIWYKKAKAYQTAPICLCRDGWWCLAGLTLEVSVTDSYRLAANLLSFLELLFLHTHISTGMHRHAC